MTSTSSVPGFSTLQRLIVLGICLDLLGSRTGAMGYQHLPLDEFAAVLAAVERAQVVGFPVPLEALGTGNLVVVGAAARDREQLETYVGNLMRQGRQQSTWVVPSTGWPRLRRLEGGPLRTEDSPRSNA